ncbi:hypothetical protein [Pantoea ananatis]|uniref:hypothetical protein n=1 Tax=Pantoea ananas TaxID=553 RepID=UPI00234FD609|nr:hypothetical protein [Pantoea ananatis]MDC7860697.1 hypothetical protein [Pantoea ananatis]
MIHNMRDLMQQEKVKGHTTTARVSEQEKNSLRDMVREQPFYSESIILRAALQMMLACDGDIRAKIVLASLNDNDVAEVMRRADIHLGTVIDPASRQAGSYEL